MRGEFIAVWDEMWRQVWRKLAAHPNAPADLFCELYRELNGASAQQSALRTWRDPATELADIVDDPVQARIEFRGTKPGHLKGETAVVAFLERAQDVLEDVGDPKLIDRYFSLAERFIEKYSLRYDLRRPFTLHPTLPGVFAHLLRDLRRIASGDAALSALYLEFEDAVRDLKADQSQGRIKTVMQKQFNLIEAVARRCPGVTSNTLGSMCNQINSWPHNKVREAVVGLYHFGCDYPGIRHGGTAANARRDIDMRDMVAMSIMLAGCTPYLEAALDAGRVYRGGEP